MDVKMDDFNTYIVYNSYSAMEAWRVRNFLQMCVHAVTK